MSITYTFRRRDSRGFTTAGSGVTFTVAVGPRGPNLITDDTALGTLTAIADALFLLAGRSDGLKPRKITLAAIHRAILAAADAAGVRLAIGTDAAGDTRPPAAHTHPLSALTQSSATTGQVVAWSGSAWVPTTVTSGGASIGGAVTGGAATRVLFVGAGPVLAEDAGLTFDPATDTLTVGVSGASGLVFARGLLTNTDNVGGVRLTSPEVSLFPTTRIAWYATAGFNTTDAALGRAAGRVIGLTDGGSGGGTLRSIPLTWTVTGTVNNAAPGVARRYRLSGSSTPVVTGISISQVDGQEFFITNPNATAVQFNHQDAGSTAANRIICTGAANITLAQDEEAVVWYDATTSRFRMRKI